MRRFESFRSIDSQRPTSKIPDVFACWFSRKLTDYYLDYYIPNKETVMAFAADAAATAAACEDDASATVAATGKDEEDFNI